MSDPIATIQSQERQLSTQAGRIRWLTNQINELAEALKSHSRAAFIFMYFVLLLALAAAYGFDYYMARPIIAFMAGLAGAALAEVAVVIIPLIILTFEVYLSLCIAHAMYRKEYGHLNMASANTPLFPPIPLDILKKVCFLVLLLQPAAALATFAALQQTSPDNLLLNLLLLLFLIIFSVSAHLIVLLSGSNLFALIESIRQYFQRKRRDQYLLERETRQDALHFQYREYMHTVTAFNTAAPTPYTIRLDALIVDELAARLTPVEVAMLRNPFTP